MVGPGGRSRNDTRGAPGPGAEDGARTRDLNLGKVALYQLSYFRAAAIIPNGPRGSSGLSSPGGAETTLPALRPRQFGRLDKHDLGDSYNYQLSYAVATP